MDLSCDTREVSAGQRKVVASTCTFHVPADAILLSDQVNRDGV